MHKDAVRAILSDPHSQVAVKIFEDAAFYLIFRHDRTVVLDESPEFLVPSEDKRVFGRLLSRLQIPDQRLVCCLDGLFQESGVAGFKANCDAERDEVVTVL